MRITRLELHNFRSISDLVLENLPETVVLVSANGMGKSTILEALIGAHDIVMPYDRTDYPFRQEWQGKQQNIWPPHLRNPVRLGSNQATLSIEVQPNSSEREFLRATGLAETPCKAEFIIEHSRYIKHSSATSSIQKLFEFHPPAVGIGFFDYLSPIRTYGNQGVGDINSAGSAEQFRAMVPSFHRGQGDSSKFSSFKTFIVASIVEDETAFQDTGKRADALEIFKEVFDSFFFPKRFIGPKRNLATRQFEILVDTPFGRHDIDLLSDGEKEVLNTLGYLFQFKDLESVFYGTLPNPT